MITFQFAKNLALKAELKGHVAMIRELRRQKAHLPKNEDRQVIVSVLSVQRSQGRSEARIAHLASCFLRGTPYNTCERNPRFQSAVQREKLVILVARKANTARSRIIAWVDGGNHG